LWHDKCDGVLAPPQDLLSLQEKRNELEKHIERIPTDQEWADSVGISLVKLYARLNHPLYSILNTTDP
jgi:ribosomal protein S15P/S13E